MLEDLSEDIGGTESNPGGEVGGFSVIGILAPEEGGSEVVGTEEGVGVFGGSVEEERDSCEDPEEG